MIIHVACMLSVLTVGKGAGTWGGAHSGDYLCGIHTHCYASGACGSECRTGRDGMPISHCAVCNVAAVVLQEIADNTWSV